MRMETLAVLRSKRGMPASGQSIAKGSKRRCLNPEGNAATKVPKPYNIQREGRLFMSGVGRGSGDRRQLGARQLVKKRKVRRYEVAVRGEVALPKLIEVKKVNLAYRQRKDKGRLRGSVQSAHRLERLILTGILIAKILRSR